MHKVVNTLVNNFLSYVVRFLRTILYLYYMKNEVLRIAEDFNKSIKQRIDELLEMDATMYTNLGSDSTKAEKEQVKKNSRVIYRAIKDLDEATGKLLIQHQDGY